MSRYYYPLWHELKTKKVVSVTANARHHPRIIKAVRKEKWMDSGFRLEINPRIALLSATSKHAILTFHLELRTPLTELYRMI